MMNENECGQKIKMKPMLATNNQRKMHKLPLWRKKNGKKRSTQDVRQMKQ